MSDGDQRRELFIKAFTQRLKNYIDIKEKDVRRQIFREYPDLMTEEIDNLRGDPRIDQIIGDLAKEHDELGVATIREIIESAYDAVEDNLDSGDDEDIEEEDEIEDSGGDDSSDDDGSALDEGSFGTTPWRDDEGPPTRLDSISISKTNK